MGSAGFAQDLFLAQHPAARGAPQELLQRIVEGQDRTRTISGLTPRPKHHSSHLTRSSSVPSGGALRISPVDHGADPTGFKDSTDALLKCVEACYNRSLLSPNGVF